MNELQTCMYMSNGKLNPELAKYMEIAHSELRYGWNIDVPQPESESHLYPKQITNIVAQVLQTIANEFYSDVKASKTGPKLIFNSPCACS